jgi:uncharacterized protein (PEP-CTERM system associated)
MLFTASLVQGINGQSQYLANSLATSTLDPYGSIVDEYSALPTTFYSPGLGLTNNVYRQHLLSLGVTETIGRDHYSLFGTYSNYQSLTPGTTSVPTKSVGLNLSWSRDIRPDLNGYASLGYFNSSNVITGGATPVGSQNTINAYLGVNYLLAENLTGSISYSFYYQPNGFGGTVGRGADVVVNQLTFQLSKTF